MTVAGELAPDATGTYVYAGTYDGDSLWTRLDGAYSIWYSDGSDSWVISAAAGDESAERWYNIAAAGEYTITAGGATGTATVTQTYHA